MELITIKVRMIITKNGQKRSKDDPEILFGSKASQPQLSKLDPAQWSKKRPRIYIDNVDDDEDDDHDHLHIWEWL